MMNKTHVIKASEIKGAKDNWPNFSELAFAASINKYYF